MLSTHLTELFYRLMIGASGFSIGLAMMLAWGNVRDAMRGDGWSWFWAIARMGYVAIIAVLLPLMFLARNANQPFNWQSWLFIIGVLMETVGFLGISLERRRRKR